MISTILWAVYFIGIVVTWFLMDGAEDFRFEDGDDPLDLTERVLAFIITLAIAVAWPIYWAICIGFVIIARFFRLS